MLAAKNIQPTLKLTRIPAAANIVTVGVGWQDPWVRNFNPFYYGSIYFANICIYEPMMVYNYQTGELLPWLATGYQWGVNSQTLTFKLRKGVVWSDGEPFGAEDVIASFKLLQDHPDITGFPAGAPEYTHPISTLMSEYIADISAPDGYTVVFQFKTVDTLALYQLATQVIVPKHIWGQIENPRDFANPDPVGTGPFTEVTVFEDKLAGFERILQLERNPLYWQEGKPYIQGVKYSFRHEENILADLAQGKLDWTAIEIPEMQKDFLDIDPSHYQVLRETSLVNLLQLNTARPPFDNPDVRKAISMSIDRQQIVATIFQGCHYPSQRGWAGGSIQILVERRGYTRWHLDQFQCVSSQCAVGQPGFQEKGRWPPRNSRLASPWNTS